MSRDDANYGRQHRKHHAAQERTRSPNGAWTPECRQRMREHALRVQPWRWSTGPRTEAGKRRSRMNAWRHGHYSARSLSAWCIVKAVRAAFDLQTLQHDRGWQRRHPRSSLKWPTSGYRRRSLGADLDVSAARRLCYYCGRIRQYNDDEGNAFLAEIGPLLEQARAWLRARLEEEIHANDAA